MSELVVEKISEPLSLDEWTSVLCDRDMPIFSSTAFSIDAILRDDKKGAMDLANVILHDPNLTAKLLKMSNSSYYNVSRQKMVTVSRAIIVLGSELIRELTLACSFFEAILPAANRERANQEIARAVHAAVQAKSLALSVNDPSPEEVFIAALLHQIGNVAFWCFSGKQGERLLSLINKENCPIEEAEKQVLGFKLTDLAVSLCKTWKLGGLIEESVKKGRQANPRVNLVNLGYVITDALKEGPQSKQYAECVDKISVLTGKSKQSVEALMVQNTDTAINIAKQFGAVTASKLINKEEFYPAEEESKGPDEDKKMVQIQILQEITGIMSGKIDINLLFEMVMEGIQRGLGIDRALFALLAQDKKSMKEKLSLGWRKEFYEQKIIFNISQAPLNLFSQALRNPQGLMVSGASDDVLFTDADKRVIGQHDCFLMPVCSGEQPIGLIYADRSFSQQPFTDDDFNGFKHFVQQANIGLAMYRMQGKK